MSAEPESVPSRPNQTARVIEELERLIFDEFEPGLILPSEGDLSEQFSASRLTVREALRVLQSRGLVDIRHGRKPVVAQLSARPVGDFFDLSVRRDPRNLLDLLEVRLALEVHIASLAAQRASQSAIALLEMTLDAMRRADEDAEAVAEADLRFHAGLAAATGNQMLSLLVEGLEGPLRVSRLRSTEGHLARGATFADTLAQHTEILRGVREHDPRAAARAMRQHLKQTERDLRATLTRDTRAAREHRPG